MPQIYKDLMMPSVENGDQFTLVAEIEVTEVRPGRTEFVLEGRGPERTDYRLEMHLDMPVDQRTGAVLGELFAQSEWRVWRSVRQPLRRARPRGKTKSGV